jgi:hypothetical protein
MRLEIHKAGPKTEDVVVEINEVFPDNPGNLVEVCETEAQALYDALRKSLHAETKAAFLRLVERNGLG